MLSRLLSFEEREALQYASHLYCSTPPICTSNKTRNPPKNESSPKVVQKLVSGSTADSQRDSRESIRESFAMKTPIFIACQADSPESLEFPIRANQPIRANRVNRLARITPLRFRGNSGSRSKVGPKVGFIVEAKSRTYFRNTFSTYFLNSRNLLLSYFGATLIFRGFRALWVTRAVTFVAN